MVYLQRRTEPGNPPPMRVGIRQRGETFVPRVVAVTVGSEVESRTTTPSITTCSRCRARGPFDLGRYPRGATQGRPVRQAGLVKVFCDIHSHMWATVMVFDHPWFANPDADGGFGIPGVPAGDREITAWHERLGDTTIPIRVEPGRGTSVEFTLPVPAQ